MKFVIAHRKDIKNKPLTSKDHELLKEDINHLGAFLKGTDVDVYLVGGVAVALEEGKFHRNHRDFDLAIFSKDLENFYAYLKSKGYCFIRKNSYTHISPRYDLNLISEISPEKINNKQGHFKVLQRTPRIIKKVKNRMDYFDLFLLEDREDWIYLTANGVNVPRDEFFPARSYPLENGTELLIPNLKYRSRILTRYKKAYLPTLAEELTVVGRN
jgi:hypothetical protein